MKIVTMVLDYVSELRPPTGILFIPQVIYEHGETWWNGIDSGRPLQIRPPQLSGNPTNSQLATKQVELAKEIIDLTYEILVIFRKVLFNML
jgi:hypothetical protein